jgi:hypothetical protein
MVFNASTWDRLRASLGGMLYQKPLPVYMRRAPRRILIQDDFESATLKWSQSQGTLTRDTTTAGVFDGTAAMKLVTGAVAANQGGALRRWGYQGLQKYVFEAWWALTAAAATTPRDIEFEISLADGTNSHTLFVRYLKNLSGAQNKWQFSADGTTFSDIAGGAETLLIDTAVPFTWHYFRGHFNMSAATPNLDELHTDTLDLTGLTAAGGTAGGANTSNFAQILVTTDGAAATTGVVDNVTLSDQEA